MNKPTRGTGLLEGFLAKKRAHMVNKLIPKSLRRGRILDVGCGETPFFLLNTEFNKKYGIDPSLKNTDLKENIILKKFNIEENNRLPFEDRFFEVITMLAVFEDLEPSRIIDFLQEAKRILKPGGVFILTTPCPWTDKLLRFMAKIRLVSAIEIREHKGAYNHKSIINYFEKVGFKRENIQFGYFEFFLNSWFYVQR